MLLTAFSSAAVASLDNWRVFAMLYFSFLNMKVTLVAQLIRWALFFHWRVGNDWSSSSREHWPRRLLRCSTEVSLCACGDRGISCDISSQCEIVILKRDKIVVVRSTDAYRTDLSSLWMSKNGQFWTFSTTLTNKDGWTFTFGCILKG